MTTLDESEAKEAYERERTMSGVHSMGTGVPLRTNELLRVAARHHREPKDPSEKHFWISMVKSVVRGVGYVSLPFSLVAAALFLIAAELLGILEEM